MASGSFQKLITRGLTLSCEWSSISHIVGGYSDVTVSAYLTHYTMYAKYGEVRIDCGNQAYLTYAPEIKYNHDYVSQKTLLEVNQGGSKQ